MIVFEFLSKNLPSASNTSLCAAAIPELSPAPRPCQSDPDRLTSQRRLMSLGFSRYGSKSFSVSDISCGDCDSDFKPVVYWGVHAAARNKKSNAATQIIAPAFGTEKAEGRCNCGTRVTFRGALRIHSRTEYSGPKLTAATLPQDAEGRDLCDQRRQQTESAGRAPFYVLDLRECRRLPQKLSKRRTNNLIRHHLRLSLDQPN